MTINAVPVQRAALPRPGMPRVEKPARPSLPTEAVPVSSPSPAEWEVSPDEVPANPFVAIAQARRSTPTPSPSRVEEETREREEENAEAEEWVEEDAQGEDWEDDEDDGDDEVEEVSPSLPVRPDLPSPRPVSERPVKPKVKKVKRARGSGSLRRRRANAGGIVLQPTDEKWVRFIAYSRYATVRHIQTLEGEEHLEYYRGVAQRTADRVELRQLKSARVKALKDAERLGTDYEVKQHDARIAEFEAYLKELDAHLKTINPGTRVRDRLDKLVNAGYLRKQSYTGINSVYWVTQKAIDVFDLDAPLLTEPAEGTLAHTLAIAYISALVQSGLKTFPAGEVAVVLTETQIRRQQMRMSTVDGDRKQRVQALGANVEGYGVPDEDVALEIADFYVAGALGYGTHIPDLVLILDNGDVLVIEVERSRKSVRELERILATYSRSREKFKKVIYLVPENAAPVRNQLETVLAQSTLENLVSVNYYDPRDYNATMVTW